MLARARIALMGAAGGLLALLVVWFAAFHVGMLQRADQRVLRGFVDLDSRQRVSSVANRIASLCDPRPYTVLALLVVLVAVARRRAWLAVGAGLLLVAAPLSTEWLKPLLAAPRPPSALFGGEVPVAASSWPSGHATAAMALALGLTLVVGSRWRAWAAAAGALFAAAVCFSFLTLQWHYPSDVLGGFLVAFVWASAAAAGVLAMERGRSWRTDEGERRVTLETALRPPAVALLLGAATVLAVALLRPHGVSSYAAGHPAFVIGGTAIGLLALGLATGFSLLARR